MTDDRNRTEGTYKDTISYTEAFILPLENEK